MLPYGVMDAAQRKYQAKLDAMLSDGVAKKIYEQASLPHGDIASAAGSFNLPAAAGQYLTFAAKRRLMAVQKPVGQATETSVKVADCTSAPVGAGDSDAQLHVWGCASHAAFIIGEVENRRKDRSIAPPGELTKKELKRTNGQLVGTLAWLYNECCSLKEEVTVPQKMMDDIREFLDLANQTLDNRRSRQIWARDKAIRESRLKKEGLPNFVQAHLESSEDTEYAPAA
jgi:hypothetical protein